MREALMRLVGEGALVLDARGTTRVPRLTLAELREIRAIRLDLEGRTAAMAADTATEAEIDVLALLQSELHDLQRAGDFRAAVGLNTVFHLSLCRLAGQPITFKIVENLWVRCGPILSHLYDAGLPPGWEPHPHTRVIDALRRRDRAEAHGALRYDIEHGGRGLEQSLGPD
jgi:DNA-binding GntR family transcriptional regulator